MSPHGRPPLRPRRARRGDRNSFSHDCRRSQVRQLPKGRDYTMPIFPAWQITRIPPRSPVLSHRLRRDRSRYSTNSSRGAGTPPGLSVRDPFASPRQHPHLVPHESIKERCRRCKGGWSQVARTIKIVVALPPGGAGDITGRRPRTLVPPACWPVKSARYGLWTLGARNLLARANLQIADVAQNHNRPCENDSHSRNID
jgi:hypothetical protein